MANTATSALLLWLVTAFSIVGFIAGFNIGVDPFGYFGMNRIGYYFSSERQFKYNLVRSSDYNALILGDSRIAYSDPDFVKIPGLRILNGGIGSATFTEQVHLLRASRLDGLKLAVMGVITADMSAGNCKERSKGADEGFWEPVRFAAAWSQFHDAVKAVWIRAQGEHPSYHPDGTRSASSRYFKEAALSAKTDQYWQKLKGNLPTPETIAQGPGVAIDPECRRLLSEAGRLADRHGFTLLVMVMPRNDDMDRLDPNVGPYLGREAELFVAQLKQIVPNVIDETNSSFSDSRNYWLFDSRHFRPEIGGRMVQDAIERSGGLRLKQ